MDSKPKAKIYNIQLVNVNESKQPPGDLLSAFSQQYSSKVPVFKKLFILYLWAFFTYFGLNSAIYSQVYLIKDANLGIVSLITANGTRTLATLVLGYFIKKLAMNWMMLIGTFLHVFYIIACFCPTWYTMIPGAVFSGIGSSVIGITAFVFMATLGKYHESSHTGTDGYRVQNRIFLLYNVAIQCATLTGYFVSYGMLGSNFPAKLNGTTFDLDSCGKDYCNTEFNFPANGPSNYMQEYWLCGICLLSVMIAFTILIFFEPLTMKGQIQIVTKSPDSEIPESKLSKLQFLLFPGNIITAVGSAFWFLDVSKAYESCLDSPHIAIDNFATYILAFIASAFLFGWYTRRCLRGQLGIFLLLKTCLLLALMFYKPQYNNIMLVFTGLWAMSDGVLTAGFPAIYGELCPDKLVEAFTSQQFWTSFGLFLVDLLSIESCMSPKLYMHAAFAVLALVEYILLETIIHKKQE